MWPTISKKLNCWPHKKLQKWPEPFRGFTSADCCNLGRFQPHPYYAILQPSVHHWNETVWVVRLPLVISSLNNEVTRLSGKTLANAIKEKAVSSKPSTPYLRPVELNGKRFPSFLKVQFLYQPGELEGTEPCHQPHLVFEGPQIWKIRYLT